MLPLKTYPEGVGEGKIPFIDAAQAGSDSSRVSWGSMGVGATTLNDRATVKRKLKRGDIVRLKGSSENFPIHEERSEDIL